MTMKSQPHVVAMILFSSTALFTFLPARTGISSEADPPPVILDVRPLTVEVPLPARATRWEKFEREFGGDLDRAPALLVPVAQAKYGADLAVFTLETLLEQIKDSVELRYSNGHIGRAVAFREPSPAYLGRAPLTFEDARLKLDLDLVDGKPYIGVRLVLPFGN